MLIVLLLTLPLVAAAEGAEKRTLEVFVRDGCPHCAEAKLYLPQFADRHPEIEIIYRPVDKDANARDDLIRYSKNAGIWLKFVSRGVMLALGLTLLLRPDWLM